MGKFFAKIVSFLIRKPFAFLSLLCILILFLIYGITNISVDDDIYSILPENQQFKKFNSIIKENNINKQVVFSINSNENDSDVLIDLLDSIKIALNQNSKNLIKDISITKDISEKDLLTNFYTNFPSELSNNDYSNIDKALQPDSINLKISNVNKKLSSGSIFVGSYIAKDPLGIAWSRLKMLNPSNDSSNYHLEDGLVYYKDYEKVLFFGTINFELNNNFKNHELNEILNDFKRLINQKYANLDFDFFGTFQISDANSVQIKKDTGLTLTISLLLIISLLIFYYRSIITPIFFIIPTIFGVLFGLGSVGYLQPSISVISIATSAVLLGIVLDYSFHFFTHLKHTNNVIKTVEELTFPMLVGSFTTVAAFASLLFTNSVVLQNFGLIAITTLLSSALFTLLFLPVILSLFNYKIKQESEIYFKISLPKWVVKVFIFLIVIITLFFLYKSNKSTFDSDLNNLGYHSSELIRKEKFYTGINPKVDKKIHLIVSANTFDEAVALNAKLFKEIESYRLKYSIKEVVSIAPFYKSNTSLKQGYDSWNKFWHTRKIKIKESIIHSSAKYDFSEVAFQPFYQWINATNYPADKERFNFLTKLGLSNLIHKSTEGYSLITSVVVKRDQVNSFKSFVSQDKDVFVFDISDFAEDLMNVVKDDFNFLLLISSLIVFVTLLLIYGRIELAILNFFPMVIAWVWILGFSAVFDVKFNFVNIIIATFIFGLGDDFTIFVTEGLLQKYKYNKKILSSYNVAIVLSALSTIFGIGVLYFAKHPSIHSIAIISVIGILCTLLVTLYIQPTIFNFLVQNRVNKKKAPITFFMFLYSFLLYAYFVIGCILLHGILLFLVPLPIKKNRKRNLLSYLISKMTKSTLNLGLHVKKQLINAENLDFSKPSILIVNHSSFLDILLVLQLHPKIVIMVKKWIYYSPFFGIIIRYAGYVYIKNDSTTNMKDIRVRIDEGYSLAIFPEGTRSADGEFNRFHKGAFHVARELSLDIQPVVISGVHEVNSKNDILIKSGHIVLNPLIRIHSSDPIFKERMGVITRYFSTLMKAEYTRKKHEFMNMDVLKHRILYNYIYKSPIIEWYVRIKLIFEKKNFEYYDELIGNRKMIYDVGCGYGYLSYYLHYRNPERIIKGVDYDQDKISIAENGYDKNEQLSFAQADLRSFNFNSMDVIFFNDVLHYLPNDERWRILEQVVTKLNEDGIIFVRDGVTDFENRHQKTALTEKFSTQILKFNKTTNQLSFFSLSDMISFAEKLNLTCEVIHQSKKTSNILFILKRKKHVS